MNAATASRLPDRSKIGNNIVQRFLWNTPLGDFYEATVGSTMHTYGLLVLDPAPGRDLASLRSVLAPLHAASSPCLARPYASGEDLGRLWVRTELTESVPVALFTGDDEEDDDAPRAEDGQDLLDAFGGKVPQNILWPVAGDLIEGMAAAHRARGILGDLGLRDIGFEPNVRQTGAPVISKWCNYGLLALRDPARAAAWTPERDIRNLLVLVRTLLCGSPTGDPPPGAWPEWGPVFAVGADPAPSDAALASAFTAMLAAHRLSRPMRIRPEDTIPASAAETLRDRPAPRPAPRAYRDDDADDDGDDGLPPNRSRRVAIVAALLALVGIVVAALLPSGALRREAAIGASHGASAAPQADDPAPEAVPDGPVDYNRVWFLSRAQLEEADAGPARPDALPARMRLAFLVAQGDPDHPADPGRAQSLAAAALDAMEERTAGIDMALDRACDFWRGYALLAGLGTEPDPARAVLLLEQCADTHHDPRAMALLGDFYASGADDGVSSENDRAAVQRWLAALNAQPADGSRWPAYAVDCARKIAGLFFLGRGIPEREQDRYIAGLQLAANRRILPCVLALGHAYLDGRAAKADAPSAKAWFVRASEAGSPEGMFHCADMIRLGLASPPSDSAAILWYRRAAKAGNADAMRAIARLLRERRILGSDGRPADADSGRDADAWDAAAAAAPRPDPLPRTTWWMGAQSSRFPAPEPGRIR